MREAIARQEDELVQRIDRIRQAIEQLNPSSAADSAKVLTQFKELVGKMRETVATASDGLQKLEEASGLLLRELKYAAALRGGTAAWRERAR